MVEDVLKFLYRKLFAKALVTPSYDVGYDITIVVLWSFERMGLRRIGNVSEIV